MKKKQEKLLVVLDLDESLVHSPDFERKFKERDFDYSFDDIKGYIRPGAKEFVKKLLEDDDLDVMVWTQSSENYAREIINILGFKKEDFKLFFSRKRTVMAIIHRDSPDYGLYPSKNIKDLLKVKRKINHPFTRMIAIDDNPDYYERQYSNLIKIPEYIGDNDEKSPFETIEKYLNFLKDKPNVRPYEKRRIFKKADLDYSQELGM